MPSLSDCLISFTFHKETNLEVIRNYENKWDFRMCAGAIDGTHIPIRAPTESHAEYLNRKGYHSILMQALVDARYIYRDAVIGWPGSVHDARVFLNSEIFKKGNENKLRFIRFSKRVDMDVPSLASVAHALHNVCEIKKNDFLELWARNDAQEEDVLLIENNELSDVHTIRETLADYFNAQY